MTEFPVVLGGDGDGRAASPTDQRDTSVAMRGPAGRIWVFALALGLISTTVGALASAAIPGRAFLAVWAIVTLAVTVSAAWEADRLRAVVLRALFLLRRGR
jgi:hypothetical protein